MELCAVWWYINVLFISIYLAISLDRWITLLYYYMGPNKGQNKENFDKYSKIFFS